LAIQPVQSVDDSALSPSVDYMIHRDESKALTLIHRPEINISQTRMAHELAALRPLQKLLMCPFIVPGFYDNVPRATYTPAQRLCRPLQEP